MDPADPVVLFIAERVGMADAMLDRHVDDGTGHCSGCAWQQASRPTFPCTIRAYADRAKQLDRRQGWPSI